MKKYRFINISNSFYLMPPTVNGPIEFSPDKHMAGRFTEADWQAWGKFRYEREEIGEDEIMKQTKCLEGMGAPTLPGLGGVGSEKGEG
jgi:hypothetical protein